MLFDQKSENCFIHLQLCNFAEKLMYYSQRGKKKKKRRKNLCVGAVGGCALVSAQHLYLAKDDNIIAAL